MGLADEMLLPSESQQVFYTEELFLFLESGSNDVTLICHHAQSGPAILIGCSHFPGLALPDPSRLLGLEQSISTYRLKFTADLTNRL